MSRLNAAALGAALLIGISGVAGAQGPGTQGPSVKAPGERGIDGQRRGGHRGHRRAGGRGMRGLVRDLNLTEAQRTQIRAIHDKYRPRFQAAREQLRTQSDAARALRQKGDTAGARAAFQRLRTDMQARIQPIQQQQQAEIRNILTAEQRTKFDAAQQRMKERLENRKDRRGKGGRFRPAQRS